METPKIPAQRAFCPTRCEIAEASRVIDAGGSFDTNPISAAEIACEAGCSGPQFVAKRILGREVSFLPKTVTCGLAAALQSEQLQQEK